MAKIGILVAPSFGGKTAVSQALGYPKPPTSTSRSPRPGEIHGKDYFFLSREEFLRGIETDQFVEFVPYDGNFYGLSKASLEAALGAEGHSVLVMEIKGATKVKALYGDLVTTIFLSANLEDLIARSDQRDDAEENKRRRMKQLEEELSQAHLCDFSVKNVDLEKTVKAVRTIIEMF